MAGNAALEQGERHRVSVHAAEFIVRSAAAAAEKKQRVVIALCGGTSPDSLYDPLNRHLADLSAAVRSRLVFTLTDERRVPLDHPESNWRRMYEGLFVPAVGGGLLAAENFLSFPSAADDPAEACGRYNAQLAALGGIFDIVVLAPGEDGHVAACWPGKESVSTKREEFVFESSRPKPPQHGYTATLALLRRASYCAALFFGDGKAGVFSSYRTKPLDASSLPIQMAKEIPSRLVATDIKVPEKERALV